MNYQINLPFSHSETDLKDAVQRVTGGSVDFRILKRSMDARHSRNIRVIYTISTDMADPSELVHAAVLRQKSALITSVSLDSLRPVVVGSGPGGLFCALWLHLHGLRVTLLEQGPPMRERVRDMARFMKHGDLHPWSNICFGAGGAGTYSDGKLITRIRSTFISFVMQTFVEHGAPESIRYLYNPHLGSNKIRQCITRLLEWMQGQGVRILYNTRFVDYSVDSESRITAIDAHDGQRIPAGALFLATGHSARAVYALLRKKGVVIRGKDFAMGLRVEHLAEQINRTQYGSGYAGRYPGIETAQYKLAKTWKDEGRAVYSFCMCPGGYILNASTGTDGVVTNGMSNYLKSGRFSNSAIVVNVSSEDLSRIGYGGLDGGLSLQCDLEEAFRNSVNEKGRCHILPGQRLQDFMQGATSLALKDCSSVNPVSPSAMHTLLPSFIVDSLRRAFDTFEHKMSGFTKDTHAQIFGIESRTSSPYRIERDADKFTSPTHLNLYPIGEGAGYAGGITSAAIDGIRAAQAWIATWIRTDAGLQSGAEAGFDRE
jgi:uncharacterized protein